MPSKLWVEPVPIPELQVQFNGILWDAIPGVVYRNDYYQLFKDVHEHPEWELSHLRQLCQTDLWFLINFVIKVPRANHPFVIQACQDVQRGPKSGTLDLWAREHFKTTVLSIAEPIKKVLNNPEETCGIFSYAKVPAQAILRSIKQILEGSDLLKACFPDILWTDPTTEAPMWGLDTGLVVRRDGYQKEATFEAHGLIDGMPTGKHFSHRVYDDVVTEKIVPPNATPETMEKVKYNYDLSENLGKEGGTHRTLGTTYHHQDPLQYIRGKTKIDGTPLFHTRVKPATTDGSFNGPPVLLGEERMAVLRSNKYAFACQQLLDPSPTELQELKYEHLVEVDHNDVPKRLFRFMTIDFAGVDKNRPGDAWGIWVVGVDPYLDDLGLSDIYLLDCVIDVMTLPEALQKIVEMYLRAGRIQTVGVEKVGASTMEVHVSNALRSKGKIVDVDNEGITILSPRGRKKEFRIEQALSWPLRNGKIKILKSIPASFKARLKMEMTRFPSWHDDGLDALAYVYDILEDHKFARRLSAEAEKKKNDAWTKQKHEFERLDGLGWMSC